MLGPDADALPWDAFDQKEGLSVEDHKHLDLSTHPMC